MRISGRREAGAELRSLGHQRDVPQWWCDSQNHATIEGRLFGGQGSGSLLPPPSAHASLKQKHRSGLTDETRYRNNKVTIIRNT